MLETQSDLDAATCQNDFLSKENSKLRHDVERLKVQLEDAKTKLFSMPEPFDSNEEVEQLKAHNRKLRYSIVEQKDTEKYFKDVEKRFLFYFFSPCRLEWDLLLIMKKLADEALLEKRFFKNLFSKPFLFFT